MHTESQAKELWCPMAGTGGASRCISSKCAAWRWSSVPARLSVYSQNRGAKTEEEAGPRPDKASPSWEFDISPDGYPRWVEPKEERRARCTGYCGLAGRQPV